MNKKEWEDYMDSIDPDTYDKGDYDDVKGPTGAKAKKDLTHSKRDKDILYISDEAIIDEQSR